MTTNSIPPHATSVTYKSGKESVRYELDPSNKRRVSGEARSGKEMIGKDKSLPAFQQRIGRWALREFGPTPAAVHAARMDREMADIHDCVAIGNTANLGRAIAGVFVVGFALAESQGIDLTAALLAEQDDNEASDWVQDSWGQWIRNGDGAVRDDRLSRFIADCAAAGRLPPTLAASLLVDRGAELSKAQDYIQAAADVEAGAFHAPRAENLTPAARGVDVRYHPLANPLKTPNSVTGPAALEVGVDVQNNPVNCFAVKPKGQTFRSDTPEASK